MGDVRPRFANKMLVLVLEFTLQRNKNMESLPIQNVGVEIGIGLSVANPASDEKGFASHIHQRFAGLHLTELNIPARTDTARAVDFDET